MPPKFPEVERIELNNPPLELVVCQLKFPTILSLAANQPPSDLQKRLLKDYPISRHKQSRRSDGAGKSSVWSFEDADSEWTISLGSDFLSLETKQYRRFDDFIQRFLNAFQNVRELYSIEVRERLGLRYVDRINAEKHPALPEDWTAKIHPDIIPLRKLRELEEPQQSSMESRFATKEYILAIRSFFVDHDFPDFGQDEFLLDIDCYAYRRGSLDELEKHLKEFRQICYRAFRWAIGDLIDSFEPASGG